MNVDAVNQSDKSREQSTVKRRKLIILVSVLVVIAIIVLAIPFGRKKAEAISCGNSMIAIGLAARIWAEDNRNYNNSDYYPSNLASMSNEIGTLKVLLCPSDHSRNTAANWDSLTPDNSSYEIVTKELHAGDTNGVFLRCKIHGFVGYADGAVYDGKRQLHKW